MVEAPRLIIDYAPRMIMKGKEAWDIGLTQRTDLGGVLEVKLRQGKANEREEEWKWVSSSVLFSANSMTAGWQILLPL